MKTGQKEIKNRKINTESGKVYWIKRKDLIESNLKTNNETFKRLAKNKGNVCSVLYFNNNVERELKGSDEWIVRLISDRVCDEESQCL
jgi:hypothetical protein